MWIDLAILLGFYVVFCIFSYVAMHYMQWDQPSGSALIKDDEKLAVILVCNTLIPTSSY